MAMEIISSLEIDRWSYKEKKQNSLENKYVNVMLNRSALLA